MRIVQQYSFVVPSKGLVAVEIPRGSHILSTFAYVQLWSADAIGLFVEEDPEAPNETRYFEILPTFGSPAHRNGGCSPALEEGPAVARRFVGTAIDPKNGSVWHVYERFDGK